jgi:ribosomal protein S12 methylthiotransferase
MTYYLDPYGCAKNQVDAENMMAALSETGWAASESAENADLIIINSCAFIESAKKESIDAVLGWRKLFPEKRILLAGCLAQRYAKELPEALPEADGFFGLTDTDLQGGITQAAGRIMAAECNAMPAVKKTHNSVLTGLSAGKRPLLSLPGSAYVKISEGCDNRCSFCAIPLIRGGLKSRAVRDIVEECKALLDRGIKELCLIGQDTGSFGQDLKSENPQGQNQSVNLHGLLEALARFDCDFRLRILYTHPDHFPLAILDLMEKDNRFLPYFDIPFQHGSEKILRAMNRRGNAESYLDLVETIRCRLKDSVIRTTLMTGFPGESEDDFALLLDFQKRLQADWLGCFTYSREENTPAFDMKGRVGKNIAAERKRLVEEAQIPISEKQAGRFIGRCFGVLVEEEFKPLNTALSQAEEAQSDELLYLGRLPCHAPEVDGSALILGSSPLELGSIVPCRVIARAGFDLEVRLL